MNDTTDTSISADNTADDPRTTDGIVNMPPTQTNLGAEPEMEPMTAENLLATMATDPTPEPTSDMSAMKLGDEFDAALIGATITGLYAYSLTRLSMIVMQEMNVHPETAQKMVAKQVIDIMQIHGAESPVFVDDSLMLGFDHRIESEVPTEEAPAVFTGEPTEKPDNVILIPGVTHGAVRGFLDPEGLTNK